MFLFPEGRFFRSRLVSSHEKCRHGSSQIHGEFGMTRCWFYGLLPLAMCIAESIAHRTKSFDDCGTSSENLLKNSFRVLTRRNVECFCSHLVEAGEIAIRFVGMAPFIKNVFANGLQERAG